MESGDNLNCVKCGLCLSVCPVYGALKEEQFSPRAKLQFMKKYREKSLTSSQLLKELVSTCLMCGSCAAQCPGGVDHYALYMKMREELVAEHGEKFTVKCLIRLLSDPSRLKAAAGLARLGQQILPDKVGQKFRLADIPLKRFPALNHKPFRSAVPEVNLPQGRELGTVLYFTGCGTQHLYDDTGFSTLSVLTHMGYRVIVPATQACCGVPMLFHGERRQAKNNIGKNLECLTRTDVAAVIVDCATCGTALKKTYPTVAAEMGLSASAAASLAERVTDIASFVADRQDLLAFAEKREGKETRITYHAPCHLKHTFGGTAKMERLLGQIPETAYVRAADFDACCGGGGTFFYEHPEIAKKIVGEKIGNAESTGASLWLTDCPVCRINLAANLSENSGLSVVHPIRTIAEALEP